MPQTFEWLQREADISQQCDGRSELLSTFQKYQKKRLTFQPLYAILYPYKDSDCEPQATPIYRDIFEDASFQFYLCI